MNHWWLSQVSFLLLGVASSSFAEYSGPANIGKMAAQNKQAIFEKYCIGKYDSYENPKPNYSSPDVQDAVKQMSVVDPNSFYFYPPMLRAYGLGTKGNWITPPAEAPKGITKGSHAFLVQLCGEFRDRPTMIAEKIEWLKKLYKPQFVDQAPIDPSKDMWSQVSAKSYNKIINFTSTLWTAKQQEMARKNALTIKLGNYDVDAPVPPASVCETKNMLVSYVSNPIYQGVDGEAALNNLFSEIMSQEGYDKYMKDYKDFEKQHCDASETEYVFDYRGDKNFKHNSPESNGMIWTANSVASHCKDTGHARAGDKFMTDADCQNYFTKPFETRWVTARAGLAGWLFHDKKYDESFRNPLAKVIMMQTLRGKQEPFSFSIPGVTNVAVAEMMPEWLGNKVPFYERPDMGFNSIVRTGTNTYDVNTSYERLRDAVNRHTNWYQSGFDDGMGYTMDQVYSPLVASSHVMAASNGFSYGGDGRHAWMFIFKVKKSRIRDTNTVLAGAPIDFDRNWFDETSLGTTAGVYAKSERALDRLGTAIEGEFAAILYLHNVEGDDGLNGPDGATAVQQTATQP